MQKLSTLFVEVKRIYYPRWDVSCKWRVQRKSKLSEGYDVRAMCNRNTKTIEIGPKFVPADDNESRWLLSHEICHAVTKSNHEKDWRERFQKVAERAELLGQKQLAALVHKDIADVQKSIKPTISRVRISIEDALLYRPDASFEEVVEWVAGKWAYTASGLLKKYPTLIKFFHRAKRNALLERDWCRQHQTAQ